MRAGSTAVILRQWHGGRRGRRKKRHRGWQKRKAKCSGVEKTKGQVWSRQDRARNRDLTHKTGGVEGAGGSAEQKILVSTSTLTSNLNAVSDIMRLPTQLEGWHCEIIWNGCITLRWKKKKAFIRCKWKWAVHYYTSRPWNCSTFQSVYGSRQLQSFRRSFVLRSYSSLARH